MGAISITAHSLKKIRRVSFGKMSVFHYIIVFCSILIIHQNEAARILAMFPIASISHQVVFRPLTQELAKRGHEVIIITPDPAFPKGETPANLTEIDVHDISYAVWQKEYVSLPKGHKRDMYKLYSSYLEAISLMFEAQINDEQVKNLLNDKTQHFDLIFMEAGCRTGVILSHIYKAPIILVSSFGSSFGNYEVIGAPVHPLLYPYVFRQKLNNLSIRDKIREMYLHFYLEFIQNSYYAFENEIIRKYFGPDVPLVQELNNNVDMLFLNINPVFEGIRPVPPSVLFMGGLHVKPVKELPKELKSYLDSSKNGVIYLSFGTNVDPSFLPPETIQTLVSALSKVPYDVLWKWNKDELPGRTDNIRISKSKWLPQSDMLRHPKIKLFITQGGLQSTDEAITAGVPLIGIPMLGDQWHNVERYEYHKIGVGLDMETLTEEDLTNAIDKIIKNNDFYRKNLSKLRSVMRDQPQPPLERAVWWTEYVIRHGGAKHLRSPAANMSWAQYLELELVFTLLLGFLTATVIVALALRYIYKITIGSTAIDIKVKRS